VKLMSCAFDERLVVDYAEVTWWNLDSCQMPGFEGEGLQVGLWLGMRNAVVSDELWLHDARLSGGLDLSGTVVEGASGFAVMGKQMIIDGDLRARGLQTRGELRLSRSRIGGTLDLTGARLTATSSGAADLDAIHARRVELDLHPSCAGRLSLAAATVEVLVADPDIWPAHCNLDLSSASFTTLQPTTNCPPGTRLNWLAQHVIAPSPAIYSQIAAAYRQAGQEQAARHVLIHRERARYRALGKAATVWGLLLNAVVGFGYRPSRALLWVAALTASGTWYFTWTGPPRAVNPGGGPTWDPLLYVLDLLLPFLSLGQRSAWDPTHLAKAVALALTITGWILATAVVGGVTRLLNRDT
jgi:hypothetical protein